MKITIEHLEFPLSVKDKITKIPKISKLHLDFISGKNIHFDKTNLSIKEPHKIIISNESSCLILISYEDDNNLYVKDSHEIITLSKLSDLVLNIFFRNSTYFTIQNIHCSEPKKFKISISKSNPFYNFYFII